MMRMVLIAAFLLGTAGFPPALARAEEPVVPPLPAGDAMRGKMIFNGLGGCAYCHGADGRIGNRPRKSDAHTELIAKLDPQPADLRNAAALKSQDEAQRFLSIKFGHPGTAMFPKKTLLLDREIADLLAYLSVLRAEGSR
jgi:mono/diheme cytochrome c family protein